MGNRLVSALLKTLVVLGIVHIIMLIIGLIWGNNYGWFGLRMVWPHWHTSMGITTGIVGSLILYIIIYLFFTGERDD